MGDYEKQPLAIIGMACRLPGASNLDAYWQLLIEGRCAISPVPDHRLDRELYYNSRKGVLGKTYVDHAGTIDYPAFDQARCQFPVRLMRYVDVGHLMMCQIAADACRQGGLDPFDMRCRNAGVYIGNNCSGTLAAELSYAALVAEAAEYLQEIESFRKLTGEHADSVVGEVVRRIRRGRPRFSRHGSLDVGFHVAANAVSEVLGLSGPSMVLDAACSSSLKALALAARDLWLGNTEMAIVGGASYCTSDGLLIFSAAQAGSERGESCPFSDRSDGLVSAEGYAAIVVKTLERALADGDPIQSVVTGIGISSDGSGKTLWAPRQEGQVKAVERAYGWGAEMSRISYVEAHATSTAVGDQTELEAMQAAFGGRRRGLEKIPMGGVKANIGHVLEPAGLAGLIKAALVLQREVVPSQINCLPLNSKVDWESLPFRIPTTNERLQERANGLPRQAAVNAFGIGGLNAHVVLEEFVAQEPSRAGSQNARPARAPGGTTDCRLVESNRSGAEPIAIIGIGALLPGARTWEALGDLIYSGADPKVEIPASRWNVDAGRQHSESEDWHSPARHGGFVTDFEYDWRRHRLPPKVLRTANPLQFMILDCFDAAIADASYDKKPFDRENTGVLVGANFESEFASQLCLGFRLPHLQQQLQQVLIEHGFGREGDFQTLLDEFAKKTIERMPALLDDSGSFTPSSLCSRLTKTYNLMGGAGTIDTGNSVGLGVVAQAVNALRTGECSLMACAVGSRAMGLNTFLKMKFESDLAKEQTKSTLDRDANGQLPGEGAGLVLLKRLANARRDGDRVRGIIHGVGAGFSADAREAFAQAIKRAWRGTAVPVESVQIVEMSAAPRKVARCELAAIKDHYGQFRPAPLIVGTAAAQFGNSLGMSGMTSLLKAACQLQRQSAPAQFGLETPCDELIGDQCSIASRTSPLPLPRTNGDKPLLAGVSSWDVCGSAYHLILGRGEEIASAAKAEGERSDRKESTLAAAPKPEAALNRIYRTVRFGASSLEELLAAAANGIARVEESYAQASVDRPFAVSDRFRLAIVTQSPAEFAEQLQLVAAHAPAKRSDLLARKSIFLGEVRSEPAKVAFLFPGQGSQYADMLQSLVSDFKPAQDYVRECDAELTMLGYPIWADLAWTNGRLLGEDVFRTQLSLLVADTIVHRSLGALGIVPDCVAGHSFGEFPALLAAGVWTFAEAARATKVRCDAIIACNHIAGGMLSTNADAQTTHDICVEARVAAHVANVNAPDQTTVGGTPEAIEIVRQRLGESGFASRAIPVNRPFHTPLMGDVQKALRLGLKAIPTRDPQLPILSSVTNEFVLNSREVVDNLVAQMTRPVRYPELVSRLVNEGVAAFVECGPRNILTGLHGKLGLGPDALLIAADLPKTNGYRQLLSVRASLEVRGALERACGRLPKNGEDASSVQKMRSAGRINETDQRLESDFAAWGERRAKAIQSLLRAEVNRGYAGRPELALTESQQSEIRQVAAGARVGWQALAAFCRRSMATKAESGDVSWRQCVEHAIERMAPSRNDAQLAPAESETWKANPALFTAVTAAEFGKLASMPETNALDGGGRQCHRFEMRVLEKPLEAVDWSRLRFNGKALIVGDNEAARELARLIKSHGGDAAIMSASHGVDKALEELQRLWQEAPLLHLYLMTGQDADAITNLDEVAWDRRRELGMILPFLVTSRWFQFISEAKLVKQASIHAATSMGGDLGFSGQSRNIEGGAIAGLVKSLIHEAGVPTDFAFQTTLVDFSGDQSPAQVAEQLLAEVAAAVPFELEIGYAGERRFVARPIPVAARKDAAVQPPSGVWVVTGGGRGITAYVAQRLAKRYGLKLHLLGSSPAPDLPSHWRGADEAATREIRNETFRQAKAEGKSPAAEWRKTLRMLDLDKSLRAMTDDGVNAVYHQCDVSNRQELAAKLNEIRSSDGPINGILHGAGIEVSSRLEAKSPELVRKTLAVKLEAAASLLDLTRNDPVSHFIGFGSVTARVGCPGQADYAMANEALAKLLSWHRAQRPDCLVKCFDWGPWDEIGMAMRPETRGNPVLSGLTAVPPAEGVEFVFEELGAGRSAAEAMIVGWDVYKIFYINNTPEAQAAINPAAIESSLAAADELPTLHDVRVEPAAVGAELPDHEIRRMVLRWVDCPETPLATARPAIGKAMILGANADAAALADLLRRRGVPVAQFKEPIDDASDEAAQAAVERCWRNQPVTHLFVCTSRDPKAASIDVAETWQSRARTGLIGPSRLISAWLQKATTAGVLAESTLVGVTALGGDCGFASGADAIEGAGISGILKAVHAEHGGAERDGLKVKVIDAPIDDDPQLLAESVLAELSCDELEIEAAYIRGRRRVPRLVNRTTRELPPRPPRRGGTWVVTGGARGITAEAVRALGKRYGLKLHLLGTRPLPKIDESIRYLSDEELKPYKREIVRQAIRDGQKPEDAWGPVRRDFEIDRNLRLMASEGVDVVYHQCDVTDSQRLAETFAEVRRLSGPISGLIHGAGIQGVPASVRDMIESSIDTARKTIAIKCTAMLEMLRLTENDPLEHCVGFGSISGRFGSNSAAFYSAGTDMLCKLMGRLRRQRPECRAVGFHWHGWADVGMITRPEGLGTAKILKLELLSPQDGVAYLVDELEAGAPECEVVVTNPKYFTLYHSRNILLPDGDGRAVASSIDGEARHADHEFEQELSYPLVSRIERADDNESQVAVVTLEFDPSRDPFLVDHRFQQRPLLPAVIVLEAFLEATRALTAGAKVAAIHDLQLHAGLKFNSDRAHTAHIRAEQDQRQVRCQLTADFRNRQGEVVDRDRVHATAVVELADHEEAALHREYRPCMAPWHTVWYPEPSNLMYHGPAFQLLKRCAFDDSGEVWGDVTAADVAIVAGTRGARGWSLHPALLDAALYLCGVAVWVNDNQSIALPHSIDCLEIGRLPRVNESCLVRLQPRESNERQRTFDIACYGDDRSVLFSMRGYCCQIVMNPRRQSVART